MSSPTTMPAPAEQATPTPSDRVSFEEFLAQASETELAEWVDGKVVRMTPASTQHQWLRLPPLDDAGIYRAAVLPGFWLRVDWLWQRPLPRVAHVARELIAETGSEQADHTASR
jgi:hypothetical protein